MDGRTDHLTARWQEGGLSKASCDKTCRYRDQPSLAASVRRRLLAGKSEFCLPWTVRVDNLPVAFGDALRVKGSTCNYLACDRQRGYTDAVRFQVSAEHCRGRPEGRLAEGNGRKGRDRVVGDGPSSRHLHGVGGPADAGEHFAHLGHFVALDSPATAAATREPLGWEPTGPGLLEDLEQDHYYRAAEIGVAEINDGACRDGRRHPMREDVRQARSPLAKVTFVETD